MYYIHVPAMSKDDPNHRLENAIDAFYQMKDNPIILVATLGKQKKSICINPVERLKKKTLNLTQGNVFSIAFFNFAGISVTKEMSATTRMVLDSSRTIIIWLCSILFRWQKFEALQLLGFAFLLSGMFIYNNIIFAPLIKMFLNRRGNTELRVSVNESVDNERAPLLRPPSIVNDSTANA
jgi:hypothetical protein